MGEPGFRPNDGTLTVLQGWPVAHAKTSNCAAPANSQALQADFFEGGLSMEYFQPLSRSHSWQKHPGVFGMGVKSRTELPRQESFFSAGLEVETDPQGDKGQETADLAHDEGRAQEAQ